jgi:hypothetical protein
MSCANWNSNSFNDSVPGLPDFSLPKHTKTGKIYYVNDNKLYQTAIKYTKWLNEIKRTRVRSPTPGNLFKKIYTKWP